MKKTLSGYTLLEIMIVVSVIGLLAAIAIPHFAKARSKTQSSVCVNNLRQIDSAKSMHALEDGKRSGEAIESNDLDPYLRQPFEKMEEPASGEYHLHTVGENPECTIGAPHVLPGVLPGAPSGEPSGVPSS